MAAVLASAVVEAAEPDTTPAAVSANVLARQERQRISSRMWRTDAELAAGTEATTPWSNDPKVIELGRRIYMEGQKPDGQPLVGVRLDGQVRMVGAGAACVLCHRRSALGAVEGPEQIAPISGRYLFDQDRRALVTMNLRARKSFNQRHEPYALDTLALALREGRGMAGRELAKLMPHYDLSDREVLALASYLRRTSNTWSPGVVDQKVRFATIITPDVDPERKRIFLDTLNGVVAQKNGNMLHGQRTMSSGAEQALQTDRSWDMQIWQLKGAPSTWQAQLERLQDEQPVFAVASGLGAGEWAPVHRFCESRKVPCWFPSVGAVPNASASDFYSVYFSRGAALEADVLARQLQSAAGGQRLKGRVLQVYADAGVAETAVAGLRKTLDAAAKVSDFKLGDRAALTAQLRTLGPEDSVVFWLTGPQLKALDGLPVPQAQSYFSAALGGGDRLPLAPEWRQAAKVIYPYQLPELRQRGLVVFKEWMRIRKLSVEDEVLQSEVYFALSYLNDTMVEMLDNVHRDYLLERGENMLSQREAAKTEDEARDLSLPKSNLIKSETKPLRDLGQRAIIVRPQTRNAVARGVEPGAEPAGVTPGAGMGMGKGMGMMAPVAARTADVAAAPPEPAMAAEADGATDESVSRTSGAPSSTNVYPRLSLGQFQRHASKGAYIVRYGGADGAPWQRVSDWVIP
jgi:hypothetical protein